MATSLILLLIRRLTSSSMLLRLLFGFGVNNLSPNPNFLPFFQDFFLGYFDYGIECEWLHYEASL